MYVHTGWKQYTVRAHSAILVHWDFYRWGRVQASKIVMVNSNGKCYFNGKIQDALTHFYLVYPDFDEAHRFHRGFEEVCVKSFQPSQERQALVGFGDFKFEAPQNLYESEDPKRIQIVVVTVR